MPNIMQFSPYPITVQFVDTDAAGRVHFSKMLQYVEAAEHAALASKGIEVVTEKGGFPKVHVSCDYKHPLEFNDQAEVLLKIVRKGDTSLHWEFEIHSNKTICASGNFTTVHVNNEGKATALQNFDL